MPHLHTDKGAYDQTASAFIIRTDSEVPRLLLHRHKKLNAYLQFGGHIELHENPWQALAHELEEEIGYTFDQLKVLQPPILLPEFEGQHTIIHAHPLAVVSHPFNLDLAHFHTDTSWVFVTDQDPALPVGKGESKHIVSLTSKELAALPDEQIFGNVRVLGVHSLDICLRDWQPIPANKFKA